MHTCPQGYEAKNGKCVECDGVCPLVCDWTFIQQRDIKWVTPDILLDPKYQNCTTIAGDVPLISASFQQ